MRPTITVTEVREGLLRVMQERQLTREDVAALVKRPSGERYSRRTIEHFLLNDCAEASWIELSRSVLHAFPRIAAPCPTCGSIITIELP